MTSPRRTALLLAGWTYFVWLTRVRNIAGDETLSVGEQLGHGLLAATFVVLASVVIWSELRCHPRAREAVIGLAGWTVAVWAVRAVGIATDGHSVAFVVVHLLLGAVSIGLSWMAVRAPGRFSATAAKN